MCDPCLSFNKLSNLPDICTGLLAGDRRSPRTLLWSIYQRQLQAVMPFFPGDFQFGTFACPGHIAHGPLAHCSVAVCPASCTVLHIHTHKRTLSLVYCIWHRSRSCPRPGYMLTTNCQSKQRSAERKWKVWKVMHMLHFCDL